MDSCNIVITNTAKREGKDDIEHPFTINVAIKHAAVAVRHNFIHFGSLDSFTVGQGESYDVKTNIEIPKDHDLLAVSSMCETLNKHLSILPANNPNRWVELNIRLLKHSDN